MEINRDTVCQVYAGQKAIKTIGLVLNTFIPEYEKLNLDYASRQDSGDHFFETENEMIGYFIENSGLEQTFYWNQYQNNPDKVMVGVHITNDDKLIISLTINANEEAEKQYFEKLKDILQSQIGVISYSSPVDYTNGQDFISKYGENRNIL